MAQDRKDDGAVNIHVFANLVNPDDPPGFVTNGFYSRLRHACFVDQTSYIDPGDPNLVAHEVGHYFELPHTHQYSERGRCRKEAIDRTRTWPIFNLCFSSLRSDIICEATGDCFRDTPADHNLVDNFSCNYQDVAESDEWGDLYFTPPAGSQQPDTRNVMSYNGDRNCITLFSRLQIACMLHSIERGKNKNWKGAYKDTRTTFDLFEPDNDDIMARQIFLNEIQERNFHQDYLGGFPPTYTSCDVDWARFVAPCSGQFTIETSHINGWPTDANTILVLLDANLNQLAENDDISATNQFSRITWNFIAGQEYLILVENNSLGTTGYYNLAIDGVQLAGPTQFCGTQTFTVTEPSGVNVNWNISPAGIVNANVLPPNQIQLTQVPGVNGEITLTGSFVHPCDGRLKQFTRTIFVGLHTPVFDITLLGNGYCQNELYEAIGTSLGNGTVSYNWRINGVLDSYHGYKIRKRFPANTTTISLTVVKAGCAESYPYAQTYICGSARFSVSPNPSGSNIKVKALGEASFNRVRISDKLGNTKKDIQYPSNSKSADINISNLPVDIYSVQIFDGSSWSAILLSVQR